MRVSTSLLTCISACLCLTFTSPIALASSRTVTQIRIFKARHQLDLLAGDQVVASYQVAIGPGGPGFKRMEGDSVTPVGTYRVVGRIKGLYHQFLTLSYPNDEDRIRYAQLKKEGAIPPGVGVGGGIGIHGTGHRNWNKVHKQSDWTLGCVALDDEEIDEVAKQVRDGTTVIIAD